MVFALLGLNVCIVGATVYLAHADKSVAIEPDYYHKAVMWEEHRRDDARSHALGWNLLLTAGPVAGARTPVTITLQTRAGAPIIGAAVRVIAFHNLRSADRQRVALDEAGEGRYEGWMNADRSGLWQFQCRAVRAHDVFTQTIECPLNGQTADHP